MSTFRINFEQIDPFSGHNISFSSRNDGGSTFDFSFVFDPSLPDIPNDASTYTRSSEGIPIGSSPEVRTANGFVRNFQQNFAPANFSVDRSGALVTIRDTNNQEIFFGLQTSLENEYIDDDGDTRRILYFNNTIRILSQVAVEDVNSSNQCKRLLQEYHLT